MFSYGILFDLQENRRKELVKQAEIKQEENIQQQEYLRYVETFYKCKANKSVVKFSEGSQVENIEKEFGIDIGGGICHGVAVETIIDTLQNSTTPYDPDKTSPLHNKEKAMKAAALQNKSAPAVFLDNLPDSTVTIHDAVPATDDMRSVEQHLKISVFKTLQDDKARANYLYVRKNREHGHALTMTVKKPTNSRISCEGMDPNFGSLIGNDVPGCFWIAEQVARELPRKNYPGQSTIEYTRLIEVENKPNRKL